MVEHFEQMLNPYESNVIDHTRLHQMAHYLVLDVAEWHLVFEEFAPQLVSLQFSHDFSMPFFLTHSLVKSDIVILLFRYSDLQLRKR